MSNEASPTPETPEELRLLIQKLSRRIRNERGDETLSDSQLSVLFHVVLGGPQSPGVLASLEHVTPPSMSRTINSLEQRGLIVREPHEEDARRVDVVATESGRELALATRRMRQEWFTQRLAELDTAELSALLAAVPILRRIAEGG